MSGDVLDGQARTRPLVAVVDALLQDGPDALPDPDALLPAWRALGPVAQPGAADDVVDVAAVVEVLARRPDVLGDASGGGDIVVEDDDPRGGPRARAVARALADVLVLRLEGRKLAHGLPVPPAAVRAAFPDPDTARAVLAAVRDLPAPTLRPAAPAPSSDDVAVLVEAAAHGGARDAGAGVHVIVGPTVRRALDLLSPYCRRLRVDLALAGRAPQAPPDDDDVYRGLARLLRAEPGCVAERRARDADEGFFDTDLGFVVDAARLVDDLVDRRARGLVAPLKRARVRVVGLVDADGLRAWPGPAPASVTVLGHGARAPALVVDGATGAVLPVPVEAVDDAVAGCSLSLPWRGLGPAGVAVDEGVFAAAQAAWRRRVADPAWPAPVVRVADDDSLAALAALAALVPATPPDRRR
jgi:hypothetical protein